MSLERRKLSGEERRASAHSPATEHGDADNGSGRQTLSMVATRHQGGDHQGVNMVADAVLQLIEQHGKLRQQKVADESLSFLAPRVFVDTFLLC